MENEIFCFCLINLIWENISYLAFVSQQVHWMKKKGVLKGCSVVKTLAHLKKKTCSVYQERFNNTSRSTITITCLLKQVYIV